MFQANDFVEITLLSDEQRFAATIRHSDGQHLLIALEPQEAALCNPGALIQIAQPIDGGMYICDSTVVNRRDNLVVARLGFPQLLQRRRAKRFECDLPAHYLLDVSLSSLTQLPGSQLETGRVRDISMSGVRLYSTVEIRAKAALGLRIHLSVKDEIEVEGSVVRCALISRPVQSGDFPYLVAVRFSCVSRINQVQLHRFLLQGS